MKTTFILAALLGVLVTTAQTGNKQTTVRIKQVKNINGVETVTDTTFSTTDPATITMKGADININEVKGENGVIAKTIVINDDKNSRMTIEEMDKVMTEKGFKIDELINDSIDLTGKTLTLKRINYKGNDAPFGDADQIEIFVVRKINITDADNADMQRLKDQTGSADGKLAIEKMNFYPNPNSGKFNLTFTLPEKGNTEIAILNTDGKVVYKESLSAFSGVYDKEIDISKNAKGVYFVKVEQGKHAQVKKIVLE